MLTVVTAGLGGVGTGVVHAQGLTVQNVFPSDSANGVPTTPTLEITCHSEAIAGHFQIAEDEGFGSVIYDSGEVVNYTCDHVALANLSTDQLYFWSARVQGSDGVWSNWSAPTSFTTVPEVLQPLEFVATADADIRGSFADPLVAIRDWDQGAQAVLRTGRRVAGSQTDEIYRTLLKFDVSSLGSSSIVANAYLVLTGDGVHSDPDFFDAPNSFYEVLAPWLEGDTVCCSVPGTDESSWTYRAFPDAWTVPGVAGIGTDRGEFPLMRGTLTNLAGHQTTWSSEAFVETVKKWIDQPGTNHGLLMMADDESFQHVLNLASREHLDSTYHPRLVIEAYPPALEFQTETVLFNVEEDGVALPTDVNLVTTDGLDTPYSLAVDASWLNAVPGSGTSPQTVTMAIDSTGLVAGVYTATVTATASGYEDGSLAVTLIVNPAGTLLAANFDSGPDGFTYADDVFLNTGNPDYADADYVSNAGFSGGGIEVDLGGADNDTIVGMSGGWSHDFFLESPGVVRVDLKFRLLISSFYEIDECSQALVAVDGVLLSADDSGYLAEICGAGGSSDTGWQQAIVEVGLDSGAHTLTIGGFNSMKTRSNEETDVRFDDVTVSRVDGVPFLTFDAGTLDFYHEPNSVVPSQSLALTTSDGPITAYTLTDDATWLTVSPALGSTPESLSVSVDAAGLLPGLYSASVRAEADGYIDATAIVTLTVAEMATFFSANFDSGTDNFFSFAADTFYGTNNPNYASGSLAAAEGFTGGALRVDLAGTDDDTVFAMSGGFSRDFSLAAADIVTIDLRYRLWVSPDYEFDECSQLLVSVDGILIAPTANGVLLEACGATGSTDSGWQQAILEVGLEAGSHTLTVGGFVDKKTRANESTVVLFDDISVSGLGGADSLYFDTDNLAFDAPQNGSVSSVDIALTSSDGSAPYTITVDAEWLSVTPASGTTPDSLRVSFDLTGLLPGSYSAQITASSEGYIDDTVSVSLNVTSSNLLFSANFDADSAGFTYGDDGFLGTDNPAYASGIVTPTGGFSGGGLQIDLGGVDDATISGMSGGWSRVFSLSSPNIVTIDLRYSMSITPFYESGECTQTLISVDGMLLSPGPEAFLYEVCGEDNAVDSGWQQVTLEVSLGAGLHTLTVGGFNDMKTRANEAATITFDDIVLTTSDALQLTFMPAVLEFTVAEGDGAAQSVDLGANDSGVVPYILSDDASWLEMVPGTGSTADTVTALVDSTGLAPGTYVATVTASGSGYFDANLAVNLQVTPAGLLLDASFDTDTEGFVYVDDTFLGTTNADYASGTHAATSGFSGGGLQVDIGGIDSDTIVGMSGGWTRDFTLEAAGVVTIDLRYRLAISDAYETDECSQALVSIDGVAVSPNADPYLDLRCGGDAILDSGWQDVVLTLNLDAGTHTLTLGGHNDKKTRPNETTQVFFDDVMITVE